MNDNRLSTNLEKINTSVSDMRTTLGATNVSIDTLADMVAENKADLDELENNMVYQVSSRAEMANLKGVEEGTACLVKTMENKAFTKRDKFIKVYFPDKVTLSNPLLEEEEIAIKMDIEGTGHGTLSGTLSSTAFIFGVIIKGQGASAKSITYTAQDNVYTRTDSYGSPIESAGELSWNNSYNFDERLSQFFIVDAIVEETNLYTNGSWVPVNGEETLELKETVTAQAATIVEQVAENSALQSSLDTANATVQQQELTITTQENTITLKDAEIASLNARIEELEGTTSGGATTTYVVKTMDQLYNLPNTSDGETCTVLDVWEVNSNARDLTGKLRLTSCPIVGMDFSEEATFYSADGTQYITTTPVRHETEDYTATIRIEFSTLANDYTQATWTQYPDEGVFFLDGEEDIIIDCGNEYFYPSGDYTDVYELFEVYLQNVVYKKENGTWVKA